MKQNNMDYSHLHVTSASSLLQWMVFGRQEGRPLALCCSGMIMMAIRNLSDEQALLRFYTFMPITDVYI
jgi:hypothetical protein